MAGKQRNLRLDELISEAGVSYAGLARRVNKLGLDHGLRLRYDKTSVPRGRRASSRAAWCRGCSPMRSPPSSVTR